MQVASRNSESSTIVNSGSAGKRLQSELMNLMMSGLTDVSAFPDGDNLFKWSATINGVDGTVYEGLTYKLSFEFPPNYPYKAPLVKFETPCFHPNVDAHGFICLDILKEQWSAVYNIQTVLLSLQSLLGEPNNNSPLNSYAASIWGNEVEFKKNVLSKYNESTNITSSVISTGRK